MRDSRFRALSSKMRRLCCAQARKHVLGSHVTPRFYLRELREEGRGHSRKGPRTYTSRKKSSTSNSAQRRAEEEEKEEWTYK